MTTVKAKTSTGGRKLTDEHRAKVSATLKAKFAALPPEEQAKITGRLKRTPPKSPARPPAAASQDPPPAKDPPAGGRVNPLAMTPLELLRSLRGRPSGADK